MDEQQLIFRDDDLYNQTAPRKWGHQIQQAPQCIILMAHCKLYDSLRANIGHCTHMGQEAFRSASEQMGRVAVLTKAMSEVEGTIECIVRYIHKKHGTENFSQWKYETQNVLRALDEKTTSNETQKKEAERKIVGTQRYEETLQKHRQKLEESREVFNEALQDYKDTYNDFRTRAPGVDAVFSAMAALFMNPKLIVAGMSDFLRDADRMKDRFLIASKAAALYNEISDMCIIPGVAWRVDEIGIELKVLSRKSAKSPANSTTKSVKEMTVEDGETLDDTMAK
uniref:BAR domain-containing protein n=1 Tax=Fusarium oxysporum (strain Fo5176) TaxID=660025 RepID=A0A0D2Y828_FUSOF